MSGPVSPPLATTESGTATIVRPTNTLEFNGADFTVTGSGSKATISIDSTGTGAALTATQVGFGDSSNLLTGSTSLTFDDTNKKLTITGDADDDSVVEIIGSDSAAGAGPRLQITNDTGTPSAIDLTVDNFAVGYLRGGTPTGTMRNVMQFGQMSSDEYTVVFNEDGLAADFRIEGDSKQNLFFVDGGDDRVGIGIQPTAGIFQIKGGNFYIGPATASGATDQTPTYHTGATALKNYLASNQTSGDQIAGIRVFSDNFRARGMMIGKMDDPTVDDTVTEQYLIGTQYGKSSTTGISAAPENGGTEYLTAVGLGVAGSSSLVVNEDGIDMDFRIEGSSNANLLYVDGGQDTVGIGSTPSSGAGVLQVFSTTPADETVRIVLNSTVAQEGDTGPYLDLVRGYSDGAGTDGASLGILRFRGENDVGSQITFADISVQTYDVSAGSEDGVLRFHVETSGSRLEYMRITARDAGSPQQKAVVINEASQDIGFRVESDGNEAAFMVNSGQDNVGIGTDADSDVEKLHVKGTGTGTLVRFESTDTGANDAPILELRRNSASPAVGDDMGKIEFVGADDGGNSTIYAQIFSEINDESGGTEDGNLHLGASFAGTIQPQMLTITGFGLAGVPEVVVNEGSGNVDFRVETNSTANFFLIDGGSDVAGVGSAPSPSGATFQVPSNTMSSYANVVASTTSPMTLTNDDLQSQLIVHASATALTINLPLDGGIKGQYFRFVSTGGDVSIVPSAVAGDTINGGTATVTRTVDNQIYECVCISSNTWILTNP